MKYGLPYKGSKNKLAERIVSLLPKRTHLIDLFCGGCAVSHAALLMNKYQHVHINDLNWMCPTLFVDALNGKYENDTRWISREDFFRLRDTDPFVAVVWSFGNNMRDYLYSKEIEPLKRAIHFAVFFDDYQPGLELGYDFSFAKCYDTYQRKYSAIKNYFTRRCRTGGLPMNEDTKVENGGFTCNFKTQPLCSDFNKQDARLKKCRTDICSNYPPQQSIRLQSMESAELFRLERRTAIRQTGGADCGITEHGAMETTCRFKKKPSEMKNMEGCSRVRQIAAPRTAPLSTRNRGVLQLTSSAMDYAKVEIPTDSVIYCDIPYEGTNVYNGAERFDYERFYDWAQCQTEPVFISSYDIPDSRFECIYEWRHRSTLGPNIAITERLYVPRGQKVKRNICQQLSLFDW